MKYSPVSGIGWASPPSSALANTAFASSLVIKNGESDTTVFALEFYEKEKRKSCLKLLELKGDDTYLDISSLVISLWSKDFQNWWVSLTFSTAKAAFLTSPSNANLFSGFPSGIL